ncbi:MAG TPA: hypothetical protein VNU96_17305 [Burkholderiales bacterium]|jgi:hypothetical protein|nr:hypothetical protein [Burkholderiales bacterium]
MRVCAVALLLWAMAAHAQWRELTWVDPSLRWRTLETPHFAVHFAEQRRGEARLVAGVAEAVYPRVTGMLDWRPQDRVHLVILDAADFANGYASPLPFNNFAIFLAPPDEGELLQNRAWLELVITHEFTHIVHLDKAQGPPDSLRRIFGRLALLFPNALEPTWITEGLAVYSESDPSRGYGRLGQSQFEGMMRAEAARGFLTLREVNADGRGFPLNRDYLYGSYFFAFVRERYGPEAVGRLVETYSRNIIPFKVDSNPVPTTGKPMDALWLEYQDWLRARFAPKSSSFEADTGTAIARAWAISSPVLAPGGIRWYIRADGYTSPRLVRQAGERAPEVVRSVEQDTRLAAAPDGALVMAQADICGNYNYLYDLYRAGANGDLERLSRCGRFRQAAPLADGRIAALRVDADATEVVLLDRQGTLERSLYRAAQGEALTGLAAKGASVVATSLRDGRWSVIEVGAGEPRVLVSDEAVKHSPRFGESEDEIYFVAGYDKAYNVWSFSRAERSLSRWTAVATGVKEISAPVGGEMLLTTIEPDGDILRLHRLPAAPIERRALPPLVEAQPSQPTPEVDAPERPYSPWSSLRPTSWLPVIGLADGAIELGFTVSGQDALGLHRYVFTPRYEFTQDEPLADFEYTYDGRHGLLVNRSLTVKGQDDQNEISAYSIKERAQWVSTWRALSLNRRFYWGLGGALEREHLHQVGFDSTVQDERVLGLVGGVDTRRERWLSEGPSQGMWLQLFAETSNGLGGAFSGNVYRADWRGHFALGKTVLALRWNEAYGQDEAERFQLGGSFSDDLFTLPVLNQREFALRGYTNADAGLAGHRARIATVEWRTPIRDVDRHFMVPPVGLNRVSLNLFVDVGAAWEHDTQPDYRRGVGAELMSELRVGYLIGLQLRAGIARGIDEGGRTTGYLRVGRSF